MSSNLTRRFLRSGNAFPPIESNKSETATKTDLKTGEKVTVFGSSNADGSVTAQMVSLGTTMLFRGGPGAGNPNPSGQPMRQ